MSEHLPEGWEPGLWASFERRDGLRLWLDMLEDRWTASRDRFCEYEELGRWDDEPQVYLAAMRALNEKYPMEEKTDGRDV